MTKRNLHIEVEYPRPRTMPEKISTEEYANFCTNYDLSDFRSILRFGQFFMNKVYPNDSNSVLYYMEDRHAAEEYILRNYVEGGEEL